MRNLQGILALALLSVLALTLWLMRSVRDEGAPPPAPAADTPAMTEVAAEPPASEREGSDSPVESLTLVGRILDAEGLPFRALRIVLRGDAIGSLEMLTEPDGVFKFRSVPRESITLDLSVDFDEAVPLGQRTLACRVEPLELDLAAGSNLRKGRIDVGTHILPRSRPCWIQGSVLLDEDWARSKELWLGDVRIELEAPSPDELGDDVLPVVLPRPGAPATWKAPPWRRNLPPFPTLEVDGTFRFAVETPHDPFLLVVRVKRFEPHTKLVRPFPDGVLTETFQLPPP